MIEKYFYFKPEEAEEIENIIMDHEVDTALSLIMDSFKICFINPPVIMLSENNVPIKFVGILKEKYNNEIYVRYPTAIKKFNREHDQQISIERVNKRIHNYFKGSIMVNDKLIVSFEFITASLLLSKMYDDF